MTFKPITVPLWSHEPIADDETFLGTWADPTTRRPLDLYFRPKPADTANGFCDAIIVRWGSYKNDCRVGPADVVIELRELDGVDDVCRAMRVGDLIAIDRGLLDPPQVPDHVFGDRFQVQFCTGSDPNDEVGWVPALVDRNASTFRTHKDADALRKLLRSRGVDPERLRIEFLHKRDQS